METWQIGNVSIHRVVDVLQDIDLTFLLPDATAENLAPMSAWLRPHFVNADGSVPLSIHTFLVRTGDATLLVDTCIGNDKPRPLPEWDHRQSDFLSRLEAAGAPRHGVDAVLCTHLHVDHVGWNTMRENGRWVPTFPNARYLIGREEWGYWEHEDDPFGAEAKNDSIRPIIESDLVDLVETDHQVTPEVRLVPTPGHTPGHVSVLIESAGERAIITGDLFHHPVQFARPHWKDIADVDSTTAEASRQAFMQRFGRDTLVLGTHFASPTSGRIVADGDTFRFDATLRLNSLRPARSTRT
ncbi:MAG: MBL fold metallo-hydrolase [Pseudomonadales bacterium]|jgi:glyoxylase-like metal-dependent hydrolase (beta-lactamase superfamily II)|nr:MBL fold metallo-hydrolase [Pseudomonadales bacterium]